MMFCILAAIAPQPVYMAEDLSKYTRPDDPCTSYAIRPFSIARWQGIVISNTASIPGWCK